MTALLPQPLRGANGCHGVPDPIIVVYAKLRAQLGKTPHTKLKNSGLVTSRK